MFTNIILIIIVLHFIVGFGWLAFKLAPRKGDELIDNYDENETE